MIFFDENMCIVFNSFFLLWIASCELNHCKGGVQVYFGAETQQYSFPIYGHYEVQHDKVNGRPYFKMDSFGFWWSNGYWFIGLHIDKGQFSGYAYYEKDVYCPYQLSEWDWVIWDGSAWMGAGQNLGTTCNQPFCASFDGTATCPIGAVKCSDYDSSTNYAAYRTAICSTLGIPLDHFGIPIPNIQEPNCTNSLVQDCPAIPHPTCKNITETVECEKGILTCDNREGLPPVCSVRTGGARISGTGLCTTGTLNLCASCEASNIVTCATGQTPVCSNYHSSSVIIPAPTCVTNANVPAAPGNGDSACNSGTISCNLISGFVNQWQSTPETDVPANFDMTAVDDEASTSD